MPKDQTKDQGKPKCFIIMPFGGWFDQYYSDIYMPAIENAGFEPKRADDLYRPGNIVNDIWTYTKEASVVLADLTNKNPNVFYELGLAHAITKPAVLITGSMDDVPFDLRSLRVIVYDKNSPNWGEALGDKIEKALTETIQNPEDAIPPTFLDVSKTKRLKIGEDEKEFLNIKKELNALKREVRSRPDMRLKRNRDEEIDPDEAKIMIKDYLKRGMEHIDIAEKLRPYGPPLDWTMKEIEKIIKR